MDFEAAIVQLQDTLIVVSEIQRKQAETLRLQAEATAAHHTRMEAIERKHEQEAVRTAECEAKLNALIEIVDGMIRKRPAEGAT